MEVSDLNVVAAPEEPRHVRLEALRALAARQRLEGQAAAPSDEHSLRSSTCSRRCSADGLLALERESNRTRPLSGGRNEGPTVAHSVVALRGGCRLRPGAFRLSEASCVLTNRKSPDLPGEGAE